MATSKWYSSPSVLVDGNLARAIDINSREALTGNAFSSLQTDMYSLFSTNFATPTCTGAWDFTGGSIKVATQTVGQNDTTAASTAFVVAAIANSGSLPGVSSTTPGANLVPKAYSFGTIDGLWLGQTYQLAQNWL